MKRLIVALILAVVLTVTLAAPAFADGGKGNMGGNAGDLDDPLKNPQGWICGLVNSLIHLGWGPYYMAPMMSGGMNTLPTAYGWAAMSHSIHHIFNGQPPAKPHWAGGP